MLAHLMCNVNCWTNLVALNKCLRQSGVLLPKQLGKSDVCMRKACSHLKDVTDTGALCRARVRSGFCVSGPQMFLCIRITRKACSADSQVPSRSF